MTSNIQQELHQLKKKFSGDVFFDTTSRVLYATDASAYREFPTAVVFPRNIEDIKQMIKFANSNKISLIPRGAGTSLAGQVVGRGIVVDVSKYMNRIIEVNKAEKWVIVEPGVVLDELNIHLKPYGLFFGPETSTANRCTLGGMLGNNACGLHSLIYGSTRDHTLSVNTILSDGSEVEFGSISISKFNKKREGNTLENKIYRNIREILSNPENRRQIVEGYPKQSIPRRNTGYAVDLLLNTEPFDDKNQKFNFSKLLAGSEGTLAFTTRIKLNLLPLPPKEKAVVCVHLSSLEHAFKANLIALKFNPRAVELMDKIIMDCTKSNIEQQKNRFFIQGAPRALLIIEFACNTKEKILKVAADMETAMRDAGYGYHFPVIFGDKVKNVWNLRKAGLGVLSNIPGDAKPVSLIEDTSVDVNDLPEYMNEFKELLVKHNLECVFHAHIGTGELHLRPLLNLKTKAGVELFYTVASEIAQLVKKYKGSLSGEHGDGRLRGEFIPVILGKHNYELLKTIKKTWDPRCILNPGKITNTPSMKTCLRFEPGKKTREIDTVFDFSSVKGIIRATEKCNGSGDCRKSEIIGGTMCPSYMATRNEKNVTRARANVLREFLSKSHKQNPFDHHEIYEILDLCLSCKACKAECPSGVDIAKLKAEFLQHYYDANGIPLRAKLIAYLPYINKLGAIFPAITNFVMKREFIQYALNFTTKRELPAIAKITFKKWFNKNERAINKDFPNGVVYLFNDEFTNFNDSDIGIKAIRLLNRLKYKVLIPKHGVSGRTFLSKGLLRTAKKIATKNVILLKDLITETTPLIGIEPSAILAFRDEYPELVNKPLQEEAKTLGRNCLMIDEFLAKEIQKGKISKKKFTKEHRKVLLHGHCQQKAIASVEPSKIVVSFPENYEVEEIPSGCCGMAGAFGYENEHYDLSMKIGELVLFPAIRKADDDVIIAAPGTSCRHQVKDGTKKDALHPVEVLFDALL